jgi:DNA-binding response OmpR family regulator
MRVLIIEDDPAIAANLYDYLEAPAMCPNTRPTA